MMIVKFDIWNNLIYANDGNVWYKQTFIESELICYEDYLGNYWTKDFGDFNFLKVKVSNIYQFNEWEDFIEETLDGVLTISGYINYFKVSHAQLGEITLMSNDLVSVTPMSTPTGQLFYMDFVYGDKKLTKYQKLKKYINNKINSIKVWWIKINSVSLYQINN